MQWTEIEFAKSRGVKAVKRDGETKPSMTQEDFFQALREAAPGFNWYVMDCRTGERLHSLTNDWFRRLLGAGHGRMPNLEDLNQEGAVLRGHKRLAWGLAESWNKYCPITAAVQHRLGMNFFVYDYIEAAEKIGLDTETMWRIANAADSLVASPAPGGIQNTLLEAVIGKGSV